MHPPPGGLTAYQEARGGRHAHHRPRFMGEVGRARPAGADVGEDGVEAHPCDVGRPQRAKKAFSRSTIAAYDGRESMASTKAAVLGCDWASTAPPT